MTRSSSAPGHNGLVCACYLARGGLKVKVLERRPRGRRRGGHRGVPSRLSQLGRRLHGEPAAGEGDPRPAARRARPAHRRAAARRTSCRSTNGYLKVGGGLEATQREFAKFSARDAEQPAALLGDARERRRRAARARCSRRRRTSAAGLRDALQASQARPPAEEARHGSAPRPARAVHAQRRRAGSADWFESEPVKAAFGFDAVVGNYASPFHPGTAYVLLHHCFGEVNGKRGHLGPCDRRHGRDQRGACRRSAAPGRGDRVRRAGGEGAAGLGGARRRPRTRGARDRRQRQPEAACSCALVDAGELPRGFPRAHRALQVRARPRFRMNVALSALPRFSCLPEPGAHHAAGIILAPSLAYMDRAYLDARAEGIARAPIVEMLIPSTLDDSLAPKGAHVASLFCQHFAPEADWAEPQAGSDRPHLRRGRVACARLPAQRHRAHGAVARPTWSSRVRAGRRRHLPRRSCRSTSSGRRGRCSGTPTTGPRSRGSTCAARAPTRAAASPARRGTTARAKSCAISADGCLPEAGCGGRGLTFS